MLSEKTVVFINPWSGIIGPNVGMGQLCDEALRRNWHVHVVCPIKDKFTDLLEHSGVTVHVDRHVELTPRSKNPITILRHLVRASGLVKRVARLARDEQAGIVCINSENMLMAARAGRKAGCGTVAVMRGFRFPELGYLGKIFFGLQRRWVSRYLAIIKLAADALVEMGVPIEQITTIPNGVDTERFQPRCKPADLLAEFNIPPGSPVIGAVTHLTPRKGVHYLLEVMGRVAAKTPNVRCVIAGHFDPELDRDYADGLLARIEQLGLKEHVILPGYREDANRLYDLFDIFVQPSETEACPRAVIEAQACGKPVIGFRVGGMPEVVADGETGFLAAPFDVEEMVGYIQDLLDDPKQIEPIGQSGRQRVLERYDLQTNVSAMVDLLSEISTC